MNERERRRARARSRSPASTRRAAAPWEVVRAAYAEREPVPRPRRRCCGPRSRVAVARRGRRRGAEPARAGRVHRRRCARSIGVERRGAGALLAARRRAACSSRPRRGAWVVAADGSKRLLGRYREASWSPFGRFVVAARANELAALEPDGDGALVARAAARPAPALGRHARRHAHRVPERADAARRGRRRHRRPRCSRARPRRVAPAWRPGAAPRARLRDARRRGASRVDADTGRELWRAPRRGPVARSSGRATGSGCSCAGRGRCACSAADGRVRFDLLARRGGARRGRRARARRPLARVRPAAAGRSTLWIVPRLRRTRARRGACSPAPAGFDGRRLVAGRPLAARSRGGTPTSGSSSARPACARSRRSRAISRQFRRRRSRGSRAGAARASADAPI